MDEQSNTVVPSQWAFTSVFEGVYGWQYIDILGHITCGVGFLLRQESDLERLIWSPSLSAARADYVDLLGEIPGRPIIYYRRRTHARLSLDIMRGEFSRRVGVIERLLSKERLLSTDTPAAARVALVDLAYNLGVAGLLNKFPRFCAAFADRDWLTCANECHRLDVQETRNAATRTMLLSVS